MSSVALQVSSSGSRPSHAPADRRTEPPSAPFAELLDTGTTAETPPSPPPARTGASPSQTKAAQKDNRPDTDQPQNAKAGDDSTATPTTDARDTVPADTADAPKLADDPAPAGTVTAIDATAKAAEQDAAGQAADTSSSKDAKDDPSAQAGGDVPGDMPAPAAAAPAPAPTPVATAIAIPVPTTDVAAAVPAEGADAAPDVLPVAAQGAAAETAAIAGISAMVKEKPGTAAIKTDAPKTASAKAATGGDTDNAIDTDAATADGIQPAADTSSDPAPRAAGDDKPAPRPGETSGAQPDKARPERPSADADALRPAAKTDNPHQGFTANLAAATDSGHPGTAPEMQAGAPAASAAATASTQAQTAVAAPVPLASLAVAITNHAKEGKSRFEIRLDPPDLGRIDVRLDVDKHGNVTSRLVVERAETLDLLRRDSTGLERALADAGLKTGDNGLQFSLRDQHAGGNAQRESGHQGNFTRIAIPADIQGPADAPLHRAARLGGLDIRI